MAHIVTCTFCKKKFDRDRLPFVQLSTRKFAHRQCFLVEDEKQKKIEQDKTELENYILKLFNTDCIDGKIRKQIKQFIEDYHYSYSGIHKALIYHFEVKKGSIDKANNGIGIVPYVYQEAYRYYYTLWEAQQKNENKDVKDYIPAVKEIIIPIPQRKLRKRRLFTFLDEEEEHGQ